MCQCLIETKSKELRMKGMKRGICASQDYCYRLAEQKTDWGHGHENDMNKPL